MSKVLFQDYLVKNLDKSLSNAKEIKYSAEDKFVFMSDVHRGIGDVVDDFSTNDELFRYALKKYYEEKYTYVEVGDGDELWKNTKQKSIFNNYGSIFRTLNKFHEDGRLLMLHGNHDMQKKDASWLAENYSSLYNEELDKTEQVFDELKCVEAVHFVSDDCKSFYVTHGHQVGLINSLFWRWGQFLVRFLWRPMELLGLKDPGRVPEADEKRHEEETLIETWCKQYKQIVLAGHTHITRFGPQYYNCGCCIHPKYISAIEISDGRIRLVKWAQKVDLETGHFKVERTTSLEDSWLLQK